MPDLFPQGSHSRRNAAVSIDVVVLQHGTVRQIVPVVLAAAHRHGILLQRTQPRQGLAGIGDLGVGASHQLHALVCGSGNAAHVLENVQGSPFAFQQGLGAAGHGGDNIALFHRFAVMNANIHGEVAANQFKHPLGNVNAAEHTAVLCQIIRLTGVCVVQQIVSGHIDIVNIFVQCGGNQSVNIGLL